MLVIVTIGILFINSNFSYGQVAKEKEALTKTLKIWVVDPLVDIQPDALPENWHWYYSVTACQGEYESTQIAIRTDERRVTINVEATDLIQTMGDKMFDVKNLQLRLVEYLPDEVRKTLVPIPGSFVLEPHRTHTLRFTAYVPKGTEPTAYHHGVIRLWTETAEIDVGMLVKVRDIKMPAKDSFNLYKFARSYGLEKLAKIYTKEPGKGKSDNSLRQERLRDGVEDLQLLWVLEQAQIKAAKQHGVDLATFDPAAKGREICSQIIKNLDDQCTNICPLHELRKDIFTAIEKTKIPPLDIGNTLTVKTTVAPTTPADFAFGTEGRFYFQFQLECSPSKKVQVGDYFRFTFRDLFSNSLTYYKSPIKDHLSAEIKVILTAEDVKLKASSYHVRVDVMRGDQSLCLKAPGGCQIYVAREGESPRHLFARFVASHLAYMWDEKHSLYYHLLPGNLSPTGDPFDPAARPIYERALRLEINRIKYYDWTGRHPMENCVPEAHHDGGTGFLYSAEAFRKIGETDRALFCEHAVKRLISAVLARKVNTQVNGQPGIKFNGPRQQQNIILKLFCHAYLYFHDVVGDLEYTQRLIEPIQLLGNYHIAQPNPLGSSEGKVYDGRILVGLSTFCLTENAITGKFDQAHVETVFDFATRISEHTLLHKGWHDDGGMLSHDGYGTMNVLWGLLAARKVALATEHPDQAELLGKAILTAFEFLSRTNSTVTGYTPQWIPSRHGSWSAGDTYMMMNVIERQFSENKTAQWFRSHLCDRNIAYFQKLISRYCETSSLGSKNTLPVYLMECEEYKEAVR